MTTHISRLKFFSYGLATLPVLLAFKVVAQDRVLSSSELNAVVRKAEDSLPYVSSEGRAYKSSASGFKEDHFIEVSIVKKFSEKGLKKYAEENLAKIDKQMAKLRGELNLLDDEANYFENIMKENMSTDSFRTSPLSQDTAEVIDAERNCANGHHGLAGAIATPILVAVGVVMGIGDALKSAPDESLAKDAQIKLAKAQTRISELQREMSQLESQRQTLQASPEKAAPHQKQQVLLHFDSQGYLIGYTMGPYDSASEETSTQLQKDLKNSKKRLKLQETNSPVNIRETLKESIKKDPFAAFTLARILEID